MLTAGDVDSGSLTPILLGIRDDDEGGWGVPSRLGTGPAGTLLMRGVRSGDHNDVGIGLAWADYSGHVGGGGRGADVFVGGVGGVEHQVRGEWD